MSAQEMLTVERSARTSGYAGRHQSAPENPRGFTLIELLVVISIVALLIAILLPTLQRVRRQAKAVACQANLRQWGVVFHMYMSEKDFYAGTDGPRWTAWWRDARRYYGNIDAMLLCPMATRYEVNRNWPRWAEGESAGWGPGSKFTCAKTLETVAPSAPKRTLYSSYGANLSVIMTYAPDSTNRKDLTVPAPSRMPFVLDSAWGHVSVRAWDSPPTYDGDLSNSSSWESVCIDRHNGAINSLFMDWSVRRVGLKDLWTLKWDGRFDTSGPWTKASGVKPESWPQWMRKFKDY